FASQTPDAIALVCGDEVLTYAQLNARANQLAHKLIEQGSTIGSKVAILLERSVDMVVTAAAVMKSGAAYIPLDPSLPSDRIDYMLEDAKPSCIVSESSLLSESKHSIKHVWLLSEMAFDDYSLENPTKAQVSVAASDLIYYIYTSGSTGRPKGVMINHCSVHNFLQAMQDKLKLSADDNVLALTTFSFDIAVLELYLPWLTGATSHIATKSDASDPSRLADIIDSSVITIAQATPTTWNMLLDNQWSGNSNLTIVCGGEALSPSTAKRLMQLGGSIWNMYGPTETTVWSTATQLSVQDTELPSLPIGFPINNTQLYLLDSQLQLVPFGAIGELYIGGDGLADGYYRQKNLTEDRFVELHSLGAESTRVYKTGDLARYGLDGRLQYLGRNDFQIKLRGHRIELEEIEQAINSLDHVHASVVTARTDKRGEQYLAAYIITDSELNVTNVHKALESLLPTYMLPRSITVLDCFPLTPNKKVDRNALPEPQHSDLAVASFEAPKGAIEQQLASLWGTLLDLEKISRHDNFFMIGGHSLLAAKLVVQINAKLDCELQVKDLFEHSTIKSLAEKLAYIMLETHSKVIRIADREEMLLVQSYAQQRIWFVNEFGGGSDAYNMVSAYEVVGQFDVTRAERALNE
ncbi:biosynthetic protein, partial [Pseudoalteromonas ulvae UL12]|uniref:non-ribosomal peptide synthetase n=1 Tax=Pseudoalteromonas ulvae TaxID=107327 RepID=UPI00186BA31F